MRYRAGASHRTLIYKRPSRSTPPSSLCISPQQLFNFERRGEFTRAGGEEEEEKEEEEVKSESCPGKRILKKVLRSLQANLNLEENQINSRIGLTNRIKTRLEYAKHLTKSFWKEMKKRGRVGCWGGVGFAACYLQVDSNHSSRLLFLFFFFFFNSRSI